MPLQRRHVLAALATPLLFGAAGRSRAADEPGVSPIPLPRLLDNHRVIVDTDPGNDDAVALLMMLGAPGIMVEAVTVTPGNIGYEQELRNALYVVDLAGKGGQVPVHAGVPRPILGRPYPKASFIHGRDGLGAVEVPEVRQKIDPEHAIDAMRRIVHAHPGEVVILALGGLTNVATALLRDPSLAQAVKGIVFVGGSGRSGVPSFNAMVDPEAASIVLNSGAPLVMFGPPLFDGTTRDPSLLTAADYDRIAAMNTPRSRFFTASNRLRLTFEMQARSAAGSVNADPFAAAIVIEPDIATAYKAVAMKIALDDPLTRGVMLYGDNRYNGQPTPPPNVNLCVGGSNAHFKALLFRTLAQA
ncbi:nucleoside hydrolase [Nguyenibacter vanlangensis]|uniref:Nucleoside hydrolase n=1 Tax=Nguyenibacter vanlangensis TaxID=1216886 RepID=A0ABZ3D9J2_9PROT